MKQRRLTSTLITVLLVFPCSRLVANSFFMGRIVTVHAYGALDAVRNPALLSCQRKDNAIGILANYQDSFMSHVSIQAAQPAKIRAKSDAFDSGNGRLSYARKISTFTLGIDYYGSYEHSILKTSTIAQTIFQAIANGRTTSEKLAQEFSASLAYAINAHHSIGLLLNARYYDSVETARSGIILASTPEVYVHEFERKTAREVSSLPRIGYLAQIQHSEIGVMLCPGKLSWKKDIAKGESYDMSTIMAQLLFKAQGELPYAFSYDMGPMLMAGAYSRPLDDIAMAIELEFVIPVTYTQPFLLRMDKLYQPLSQLMYFTNSSLGKKNTISTHPSVSVRGGFEFYVSRTTVFTLGGGLSYYDIQARQYGTFPDSLEKSYSYNYSFILYGMAGIDFLIGRESIITIGTTITHARLSMEQTRKNFFLTMGRELHTIRFKVRGINADIIVASSSGF